MRVLVLIVCLVVMGCVGDPGVVAKLANDLNANQIRGCMWYNGKVNGDINARGVTASGNTGLLDCIQNGN